MKAKLDLVEVGKVDALEAAIKQIEAGHELTVPVSYQFLTDMSKKPNLCKQLKKVSVTILMTPGSLYLRILKINAKEGGKKAVSVQLMKVGKFEAGRQIKPLSHSELEERLKIKLS